MQLSAKALSVLAEVKTRMIEEKNEANGVEANETKERPRFRTMGSPQRRADEQRPTRQRGAHVRGAAWQRFCRRRTLVE
ncbi:MAG: hypothetical protein ACRD8A_12765 [Candidatus Acidiferrales bacterium]